jgi:hypothetical protein
MLINTSSDPTARQTYHEGLEKLDNEVNRQVCLLTYWITRLSAIFDQINARKRHLSDINIAKNRIVAVS